MERKLLYNYGISWGLSLGEYISYLKENNIHMKQDLIIKIILQIVNGLGDIHKCAHADYSFNFKLIDFDLTVEEKKNKGKVSTLLNQSVQPVFEGSVLYSSP